MIYAIGLVGLYNLGLRILLPGVDRARLQEFLLSSPDAPFIRFLERGPSVFSLGILPYFTASVLVLLLSGAVPALGRLRDGPAAANARLDLLIYVVTAAIALVQAWGLAVFLEISATPAGQPLVVEPHPIFRIQTVAIVATGAMLLVWLADAVTRHGLVNGVALIVLVDLIAGAVERVAALGPEGVSARQGTLVLVALVGMAALCVYLVRAGRRIPLRPSDGRPNATWTPSIVLRPNTVGVLPVGIAGAAMLAAAYLGVARGSAVSWILHAGLVVFFTYLWTAVTFSGAAVVDQIRRFGFELAEMGPSQTPDEHLDGIVERLAARHAALLVCLVLFAPLVLERVGIGSWVSWLAGPWLLVAAAIGVTIVDGLRTFKTREDSVPVFEAETELEVDLVRGVLEQAGIPTQRVSTRVIPVTGTLAFWEVSRPPYPSWTIHRRLGAGGVYVAVAAERAQQALRIVAPYSGRGAGDRAQRRRRAGTGRQAP